MGNFFSNLFRVFGKVMAGYVVFIAVMILGVILIAALCNPIEPWGWVLIGGLTVLAIILDVLFSKAQGTRRKPLKSVKTAVLL